MNPLKQALALRHRISFRLYLAIIFAVSLTFAASVVGWFSFDRVGVAQSRVNEKSIPEIAAAFAVAQYTGDLVTSTDRLSTAATQKDLQSIRDNIGRISPGLSERVAFLAESGGADEAETERLARIQANSDSLVAGVSQFESNIVDYFELAGEGERLRRQLANARSVWDSVAVSVTGDELAYLSENPSGSGSDGLQSLVRLQENVDSMARSLSSAAVAVSPSEIGQLQGSFQQASSEAEGNLAELAHLPSHANLTQAFTGLASLGEGDGNSFDIWARELALTGERRQLLDSNYETAVLLAGDVEALVQDSQARAEAATEVSAQAVGLGQVLLVAISMVSLTGALLVAWLLVSSLIRRLGRMSVRMRGMASGDLEAEVEVDGHDEVAEMAAALEVFRHNAREAIRLNLVEELAQYLQERNVELAEALDNLRKAQDRIVAQEKLSALGELASGLAHEINNPLNFVNNFSETSVDLVAEMRETLEESGNGQLSQNQLELLEDIISDLGDNMERIRNNGGRASRIVQAMLTMGRDSVERQACDINRLLDEHAQIAYQSACSADEDFRLDLQFDCGEMEEIEVNPRDIGRVFINLVSNACYATDEKRRSLADQDGYEPSLRLSTRRVDGQVEIRLRDNGTGIPEDVVGKIFNPFFTTKPTDRGTGLGLTICNDVIREHGGLIEVSSEVGEFTEMLVILPVDLPAAPDPSVSGALRPVPGEVEARTLP